MKRLVVDARLVRISGIGRYLRHILDALRGDDRFRATLLGDPRELAPYLAASRSLSAVSLRAPLYSLSEQIATPLAIPPCDLFFSPHYVLPLLHRGPMAVTIHDVIHLEDPAFAPHRAARAYARLMLRAATRRARRVLTDSRYTARRLTELLDVDPDRVRVIPLGVDPGFFAAARPEAVGRVVAAHRVSPPYVLFVGNAKRHKNLRTLIAAFARLRARGAPHQLVLAGPTTGIRTDVAALEDRIRAHGLEPHVRLLGHVPEADLAPLYRGAAVFVLPSLVEGFGLPPLEAMACGTPVVISDRGSLPEVCGDAAVSYAPAEDPEALAGALERVLTDAELRERLIAAGRERARLFTSDGCARATLDALYAA